MMTGQPVVHDMTLYPSYFDRVADGSKPVEIRVLDAKRARVGAGHYIRFTCESDQVTVRVRRVATYASFEELLDSEGPEKVNPHMPREQQLAGLRQIYGPEKEALGAVAFEIERVASVPA